MRWKDVSFLDLLIIAFFVCLMLGAADLGWTLLTKAYSYLKAKCAKPALAPAPAPAAVAAADADDGEEDEDEEEDDDEGEKKEGENKEFKVYDDDKHLKHLEALKSALDFAASNIWYLIQSYSGDEVAAIADGHSLPMLEQTRHDLQRRSTLASRVSNRIQTDKALRQVSISQAKLDQYLK